ncbi:PH domain-containing protein [Lysinibacillus xylanilyticus]|uniref:PH domain-containing protein n=1 Tax=Lysinibacillus xylanilyticus TaxID=582475 RepID=UPI003CFC6CB4
MSKSSKFNETLGVIEYPITLEEMKKVILEFPKTERKFYEISIKALNKSMKNDEKILSFTTADSKLTKTGFMIIGDKNLYFTTLKGGLLGGADVEVIKYSDIKSVDFDIAPNPLGMAQMELGIILLQIKGMIGSKKRTIRNIPDYNLDYIVKQLRSLTA